MSWRMNAKRRLNSSNLCASASARWPCASASGARRLASSGPKQVEIFPVERTAVIGGRKEDEANRLVAVDERHAHPRIIFIKHPLRHGGVGIGPAIAKPVQLQDPARGRAAVPERLHGGKVELEPGATGPVPLRRGNKGARMVALDQQAAGSVEDVREGLDDAHAEAGRLSAAEPPSVSVKRSHSVR